MFETFIEFFGLALRFIGWVLIELLFEMAICGVGYHLCRLVGFEVEPDGAAAIIVGVLFWLIVAWLLWEFGWLLIEI
ncbi:hypothetical protein [Nevskia sp.]|uniref:hypothetical protein n=1 Tax=Nevskia sp. TaxID=1929292 RepID=UPI0025F456D8|nr:hypothetical protein [Nevskia sp.]